MGTFRHPASFWLGTAAVAGGVALHLPMFISARSMHYAIVGMGWDHWMIAGMVLIVAGLAAVLYGLAPARGRRDRRAGAVEVRVAEDGPLSRAHVALMLTLTIAVAIDSIKPFTFAFILPGVAREYHLSSPAHHVAGALPVAWLPFAGITGTVIGSLLLGYLGDRFGRRALILVAATIFIGTSACGAMPEFGWNIAMCFLMGVGVGGLLPIAYSLLTETIPARQRGQAIVLVAGIGTALGFLLTSWLANWLVPSLSWRIMWLIGVPTGLALILLNRYVPESPRYLLATGRAAEAREVMRSFGTELAERRDEVVAGEGRSVGRPLAGVTAVLCLYGIGWGLVNFGFLTWLPIDVAKASPGTVTAMLAKAALFALPGSVVVAWLYGRWSSKGTLVLSAALMVATLCGFAAAGNGVARHHPLFIALVASLLVSMWGTISALSPYGAEVYPTTVRSGGAGLVAGATKLGGVIALGMAVAAIAPPDVAGSALVGAVPAALAALLLIPFGTETRGRALDEIAVTSLGVAEKPA